MEEYILVQDNDSHWYVIPSNMDKHFNEWLELNPEDESSWELPKYTKEVGGSPSLVKFKEFRIG